MKKSCVSSQNLGSFPSPGAPNYRDKSLGNQKGWSSERVTKPANRNNNRSRKHASVAGFTPFSSGRTMPSKWDEAERWICSPVSVSSSCADRYSKRQRRPKSISGPIVPPGNGMPYYSNYSPAVVPVLRQGLVVQNLVVGSPFSTGVLAPDAVSSVHHFDPRYDIDSGIQYSSPLLNENNGEAPLTIPTAPTCLEVLRRDPSSPLSECEKEDRAKNEDRVVSPISKHDKGTQMSSPETESDAHSSPKSSSATSSAMNQRNCNSPKLEVRDVQVDSQTTVIRWSKRHANKLTKKDSQHVKDLRDSSTEAQSSCWDIVESTSDNSRLQREEAKIIAWENLQKAKAEAAIRKLEMKLEKKRSSSMDKILNKLRRAQMKAENMRSIIPVEQCHRVSKTRKVFSFTKYGQIWSLGSCFTTHALD